MNVAAEVPGQARAFWQIPTTTTSGEVVALATRIRCQIPTTTSFDQELRSSARRNREIRRQDVPTNASIWPNASLVDIWQGIPREPACRMTPQRLDSGVVR